MKIYNIIASTVVTSNRGFNYEIFVNFTVDKKGRIGLIDSQINKVRPQPWMLLDLVDQVYKAIGIFPRDQHVHVRYARYPVSNPYMYYTHHPALEVVETGKKYRLDHEVDFDWLKISFVPSMVYYSWKVLDKEDSPDEDFLQKSHGEIDKEYRDKDFLYFLDSNPQQKWNILIQPL